MLFHPAMDILLTLKAYFKQENISVNLLQISSKEIEQASEVGCMTELKPVYFEKAI